MSQNKAVRINIAFKIPDDVTSRAIYLSQKISKDHDVFFSLDGLKFYPHITIYSPKYLESDINKVLDNVEEIVKNFSNVEFKFQKISGGQGYAGIKFEYTPSIKYLHEKIVLMLDYLRLRGIKGEYDDYYVNLSPEQEENVEKYGYSEAMDLYSPHLTLTRFKDVFSAEKAMEGLEWNIDSFTADKIAVYKMGDHGTCRELIAEFPFGKG